MKLHHAGALALVGWYLMLPPSHSHIPDEPDTGAPLRKWHIIGSSFDSAAECEIAKVDLEKKLEQHLGKQGNMTKLMFLDHGACVATDDPRLKEK